MRLRRTVTIVVVGGACAAWLAAAATSSRRDVPAPVAASPAPVDVKAAALLAEVERLHGRVQSPTVERTSARNPFLFAPRRPAVSASIPRPTNVETGQAVTAAPAPGATFKLEGIAEDTGSDGPVRTAIVSAAGEVFLAKVGEPVTPRYRVVSVTADAVELADVSSGEALRLHLR